MNRSLVVPRRTKLVATVGPASAGRAAELVSAGLDVARINLSHGSHADHTAAARAIRSAAANAGRHVGILVDLPGPKLRLGNLVDDAIELSVGSTVAFGRHGRDTAPASVVLPLAERTDIDALQQGDRVLLADGAVELRVEVAAAGRGIVATVVSGSLVRSRAGVSIPAERIGGADLAAADDVHLPHLLRLAPDYVGQSFIRSAAEVAALRQRLPAGMRIVAKIETRPAVDAIESILEVADAIMVARGDLGVELPFESVPLVQKDLVTAALRAGRPSIVATQMLESMVDAPRPTRAEASDVANAILDGADAVMLSAETAIGSYPVAAVRAAGAIAAATDSRPSTSGRAVPDVEALEADPDARATTLAAVTMAHADPDVVALACFTRSGRTARLLSALRPHVPIRAFTPSAAVARSLSLHRGITATSLASTLADEGLSEVIAAALVADESISPGAAVVLVRSSVGSGPNTLEVLRPRP